MSCVSQGLLNDVRWIKPGGQPTIHPYSDHSLETRTVYLEQPLTGPVIPLASSLKQGVGLRTVISHRMAFL
jgi:hypothetical protein